MNAVNQPDSRASSPRPLDVIDGWLRSDPGPQIREYLASHRARYTALIELLDRTAVPVGARALEVGCSDGCMGALLAERYGWRLAGVDYEEWAMTRALDRGLDARRCDVDAESLPFGNAEFRLVLFDAVLEHLYNPRRALSELARVTAPGGLLILGTPNASELGLRVRVALGANPFERLNRFNAIHDHARMSECAVLYTPQEIIRALQDTFDPVSVKWTHLFAPDHQSRSSIRNLVTPVRLAICRAFPSLSGYFYLVLRRKAGL